MRKSVFVVFFMILLAGSASAEPAQLPQYKLNVSFDIEKSLLKGRAEIMLPDGAELAVHVDGLSVTSIMMNGNAVEPPEDEFQAEGRVEIIYEGTFNRAETDFKNSGVVSGGIVSAEGIFLTGMWYPSIEGLAHYRLKALLPDGFQAVSEAEEVTVAGTSSGTQYSFSFPHPLDGINLVAAHYTVEKETFEGIEIFAYFFREDAGLIKTYMEHTKKYIMMYGELFGRYPYKRFSIVENFLPTGYSMPTFTLLGRTVVRLPFIVSTSLGHEVLHQWFGNYVFADYEKGNWVEGLTSYLADHFYDDQKGRGWKHRKKLLLDYSNYVNRDNEIPLCRFMGRKDFATKAIGYGKGAMVFHMLKKQVGDENFYSALKTLVGGMKFKQASWDDIMEAFQKTAGKDLEWFFKQWLTVKGSLCISVKDARSIMLKGVPFVSFQLIQKSGPWQFNLPVRVVTDKGEFNFLLAAKKEKEFFEISVDRGGMPLELIIDADYDLMRELSEDEIPPVVSGLLGDDNRLVAVPDGKGEAYGSLSHGLKVKGFNVVKESDVSDKVIKSSSILFLAQDGPVVNRLFGKKYRTIASDNDTGVTLTVRKNPLNSARVVVIAKGSPGQLMPVLKRKIFHYGRYSTVRFQDGRVVLKETAGSDRGIRCSLYSPVMGVKPEKMQSLDDIISSIVDVPVIYVGEGHTMYEDHMVQLHIIRSLHENGCRFAIGMEMFQTPFQSSLDNYIAGHITEKKFLKESEYFKRWKYNYHLYREIIDYARAKGISIVALNQKQEIIKKVSRGGIDALTADERKSIPDDMDLSDEKYRQSLKEVFSLHGAGMGMDFNNFYQAQVLWDETMAHSVNEFLVGNPGYQMVVIAGSGHIAYGSGIPKRLYRLNGKKYVTLVNVKAGSPITGIADFVLFPESRSPLRAPVLGIIIDKSEGMVRINMVKKGSLAWKAGLKKKDRLMYIDNMEIRDVDDVHIALLDKKQGDTIKITVLRKRFLFGNKERLFSIVVP